MAGSVRSPASRSFGQTFSPECLYFETPCLFYLLFDDIGKPIAVTAPIKIGVGNVFEQFLAYPNTENEVVFIFSIGIGKKLLEDIANPDLDRRRDGDRLADIIEQQIEQAWRLEVQTLRREGLPK